MYIHVLGAQGVTRPLRSVIVEAPSASRSRLAPLASPGRCGQASLKSAGGALGRSHAVASPGRCGRALLMQHRRRPALQVQRASPGRCGRASLKPVLHHVRRVVPAGVTWLSGPGTVEAGRACVRLAATARVTRSSWPGIVKAAMSRTPPSRRDASTGHCGRASLELACLWPAGLPRHAPPGPLSQAPLKHVKNNDLRPLGIASPSLRGQASLKRR